MAVNLVLYISQAMAEKIERMELETDSKDKVSIQSRVCSSTTKCSPMALNRYMGLDI